ncbi:reverse transcriptase domain-containing protein [Weissella paramesenteroides]
MDKNKQNNIIRRSLEYSRSIAKSQPYKLQFIALDKYFKKNRIKINRHNKYIFFKDFSKKNYSSSVYIRDFLFKHDYMTPRQAILLTPNAYLFYTVQTFKLVSLLLERNKKNIVYLNPRKEVSFSLKNTHIFYAGILQYSKFNSNNASYKKSYNYFKKKLSNFQGNQVLKVDIQDFFLGITNKRLKKELMDLNFSTNNHDNLTKEITMVINSIINFFEQSGYTSLPQSQGSIASSVLSQLYLSKFTSALNNYCCCHGLTVVRYVDDMFIDLPKEFDEKLIPDLLDLISTELWKLGLSVNSKKIAIIDMPQFRKLIKDNLEVSYADITKIKTNKRIQEKTNSLLTNNGYDLLEFMKACERIIKDKGYSPIEYKELFNTYFSVENDDANKVLNNLVFGNGTNSLSFKRTQQLLEYVNIIPFDPHSFTILFIKLEKRLQKGENYECYVVRDFLRKELDKNPYTVRKALMETTYYTQNKEFVHNDKGAKLQELNKKFREYILHYIDK